VWIRQIFISFCVDNKLFLDNINVFVYGKSIDAVVANANTALQFLCRLVGFMALSLRWTWIKLCSRSMRQGLCNDTVSVCQQVLPSVWPILRRVCCCGPRGQAISIDRCTARLQQAHPSSDPYPQQQRRIVQKLGLNCQHYDVVVVAIVILRSLSKSKCDRLNRFVVGRHILTEI